MQINPINKRRPAVMGRKPWCCKIHLVAEHPRQWSETASESEAEEGEGEEGEVIQEGVVAGILHDGIKY